MRIPQTMPSRRVRCLEKEMNSHPEEHSSDKPSTSQNQEGSVEYIKQPKFAKSTTSLKLGGDAIQNCNSQYGCCQMFISYSNMLEHDEELCLSFLSINPNQDVPFKLYKCKQEQYKSNVTAICIIENSLWLGTDMGEIVIYPDMRELQFSSGNRSKSFHKAIIQSTNNLYRQIFIQDLQYLEEWNCVIAATSSGDIFWMNEDWQDKGLTTNLHCNISPPRTISPINRIHIIRSNNELQIWCTRGSIPNPLSIIHLPIIKQPKFRMTDLKSSKIKQPLQYITGVTYRSEYQSITKVWASVMNRSMIVCWDTDKLKEPTHIDISQAVDKPDNFSLLFVQSLFVSKESLFVGTNKGHIISYSLNCDVRSVYRLFSGSVRHIVQLPTQLLNNMGACLANKKTPTNNGMLLASLGEGLSILERLNECTPDTLVFSILHEFKK